jgi:glycosyltransferase 2 family protein
MEGLQVLTSPSRFLIALFWIAISWVIALVIYWEMLIPISPQSPLWHGAFVNSVLAMGIAIPSSPGALGIFEGSIIAALKLLNITAGAVGYAFLMHIFQFIETGILGFWGLISEGRSISSAFDEIQTGEPTS